MLVISALASAFCNVIVIDMLASLPTTFLTQSNIKTKQDKLLNSPAEISY